MGTLVHGIESFIYIEPVLSPYRLVAQKTKQHGEEELEGV